jgi:hypothetical protein
MDARSLDEVCEQLSREIAAELESQPGSRWRCPVPLRPRIVSYARVCRDQGEPLHECHVLYCTIVTLVGREIAEWQFMRV